MREVPIVHRLLPTLDRYTRLAPLVRAYRGVCRQANTYRSLALSKSPVARQPLAHVLIAGVYLADRKNLAEHLVRRFASARAVEVTQAWACMLTATPSPGLQEVTFDTYPRGEPKFVAINRLLARFDLNQFDFVIVTDDDIAVPKGFLDAYIKAQIHCGFGLAQPARTASSCGTKTITVAHKRCFARQTRFVEIGPLFSISKALYADLLPFVEDNPMGWGLDYHWPVLVERRQQTQGVIDCVPVDHSIRPLASAYSGCVAKQDMLRFLARVPHLSPKTAEVTLRRIEAPEPLPTRWHH